MKMTSEFVGGELKKVDTPFRVVAVINDALKEEIELIDDIKALSKGDSIPNCKSIDIVPSSENLGFAKGNNLGVKFLLDNYNDIDYLLFSNNDIEIKSPDCISILINKLEGNDKIGAIGPRVIGLDGKDQSPHDKPTSIYRQIAWNLFPFLRGNFSRKKKENNEAESNYIDLEGRYTYWVTGSFFIMKNSLFNEIGGFDPNTFLYAEEQIISEKLKLQDKKMYFEPSVTVVHYEGATTKKNIGHNKSYYIAMQSNCYYYKKYLNYNLLLVLLYKYSFIINQKFWSRFI